MYEFYRYSINIEIPDSKSDLSHPAIFLVYKKALK